MSKPTNLEVTIATAKVLLKDKNGMGGHGFKGKQIKVWSAQRRLLKAGLRAVIANQRITRAETEAITSADCPQMTDPVTGRWAYTGNVGGTRGGAKWVRTVQRFIDDIRYNRTYTNESEFDANEWWGTERRLLKRGRRTIKAKR